MGIEDHIVEAFVAELQRQATEPERELSVQVENRSDAVINGRVDLDKMAMVVMGALAGGP